MFCFGVPSSTTAYCVCGFCSFCSRTIGYIDCTVDDFIYRWSNLTPYTTLAWRCSRPAPAVQPVPVRGPVFYSQVSTAKMDPLSQSYLHNVELSAWCMRSHRLRERGVTKTRAAHPCGCEHPAFHPVVACHALSPAAALPLATTKLNSAPYNRAMVWKVPVMVTYC